MTPIQGFVMERESPISELAMLLVGGYKSGKSWLAATAPGNILILDMDRRLKALAAHPNAKNIFGLEFTEGGSAEPAEAKQQTAAQAALSKRGEGPSKAPVAFNDMLEVVSKLETSPYLRDLHETFAGAGDRMVDSVVFDSIQTISNAARDYVMFVAPETAKTITLGLRQYRVANSWNAWGGEERMVTEMIMAARSIKHCKRCFKPLSQRKNSDGVVSVVHTDAKISDHQPEARGINVICTLHEIMEMDPRSTDENPIFTGKIEVYPRRYNKLLLYFNEVWRITRESGRIPSIQFDPNNQFVSAATALGLPDMSKLPVEQRSDMAAILRLARAQKTNGQTVKETKNANDKNSQGSIGAQAVVPAGSHPGAVLGLQTGEVKQGR